MGRKSLGKLGKRHTLRVRISELDQELIEAAVELVQRSEAEWVREVVLGAAQAIVDDASKKTTKKTKRPRE